MVRPCDPCDLAGGGGPSQGHSMVDGLEWVGGDDRYGQVLDRFGIRKG